MSETKMKKQKRRQVIWRIFTTVCLAVIIFLIIYNSMHCNCDCQNKAGTANPSYSFSTSAADGTDIQK